MKKIFIAIAFFIWCVTSYSQSFVPRSNDRVTAVDARLKASLNFYLPVGPDTTLNGGIDSVGALFMKTADTTIWVRTPRTGAPGNKWSLLYKLNSTPITQGVVSFNGRTGVVTLIGNDVVGALGYSPANELNTISINGVTQNIGGNRTWTVGDVRTDGSYANPSWITSLAWSKITGAPSFNAITSLNGLTATTQTFSVPGTSGTAPSWSSSGSIHTLNIPLASTNGVTAGLFPNSLYTQLVTLTGSQTLTNKTLTTPFINFGSDANGDIMVRISGNYTRRAVGANGTVLGVSGGLPTYVNLNASYISDFVSSARNAITLTTVGTAGASTYNPLTGILNIPNYTGGGGGGDGTVTYVDLTLPASVFSVSGGPITTSGTFNGTFINQSAYTVFARGASTGPPSFQGLTSTFISDFVSAARGSISVTGNGSYNSGTGVITINSSGGSAKEAVYSF